MASLDDVTEKLKSEFSRGWEKIRESSAYNQLRDRFENLSPVTQRLVLAATAFVLFAFVMSFPITTFLSGSDSIATYESQRDLIRDLFKVQQESQNALGLTAAPPADALKTRIDDELQHAQLLPEQIGGVSNAEFPPNMPKERIDASLRVNLRKLNLRQVVDVGHQISSIHPAIKMVDLSVEANAQDPRYFDVVYRLITLKIPVYTPPPVEDENPGKNKKSATRTKTKGNDE